MRVVLEPSARADFGFQGGRRTDNCFPTYDCVVCPERHTDRLRCLTPPITSRMLVGASPPECGPAHMLVRTHLASEIALSWVRDGFGSNDLRHSAQDLVGSVARELRVNLSGKRCTHEAFVDQMLLKCRPYGFATNYLRIC